MFQRIKTGLTAGIIVLALSATVYGEDNKIHTYAMTEISEYSEATTDSAVNTTYKEGECVLTEDVGDGWLKTENGFVQPRYCMVSVKDMIPEIDCDITNAYDSRYMSKGEILPVVTGEALYFFAFPYEDDYEEMDDAYAIVKYSVIEKLKKANEIAKEKGYRIRLYDTYRPRSLTIRLREAFSLLCMLDSNVQSYVNMDDRGNTWGQDYFLASETSPHNYGCAVDATLVNLATGEEVGMPTAVHELSTDAMKYTSPEGTEFVPFEAEDGNNYIQILDEIFTEAGMKGLASEYWHFQDDESMDDAKQFVPRGCDFE